MANTTYSEKLKSPLWQKKRLSVLERDNWCCVECKNGSENLQVHHVEYHKDKAPWEYEDWNLVTLCETCHKKEHGMQSNDMLSMINEHILNLQQFLKRKLTDLQEEHILTKIVELQKIRKEFSNG